MKKLLILTCLLIYTHLSYGQSISVSDSLQIRETLKELFRNFESPNYDGFSKISSEVIWCLICDSGRPPNPNSQKIGKKEFYSKNLKNISNSINWERASKSHDIKLHKENNSSTDITAFITIWERGEYAPGHDGAAIGIHFKKIDGVFKFSGIETIP